MSIMNGESDISAYIGALQNESMEQGGRARQLLTSGVITKIASFVDQSRRGIHVDVNGHMGMLAMAIAEQSKSKVITLMRNQFMAARATEIISKCMPIEAHLGAQVSHQPGRSTQMQYPISMKDLKGIDLQNPDAITVLCDDIRNRGVLDSVLNHRPVDSVSWTFPIYNANIAAAEYPRENPIQSAMQMAIIDREHVMRYASMNVRPGGQFVIAGDARIEEGTQGEHAQDLIQINRQKMAHWGQYWEPKNAFAMRNMKGGAMQSFGQNHQHFNSISIMGFQRNRKQMHTHTLAESDKVLGVR
jgi:hypothetical protein